MEEKIRELAERYSRNKKYINSTPIENWLRAERQFRGSSPRFQPLTANILKEISTPSKVAGNLLTMLGFAAAVLTLVGSLSLAAYLIQVGAPIPPIE